MGHTLRVELEPIPLFSLPSFELRVAGRPVGDPMGTQSCLRFMLVALDWLRKEKKKNKRERKKKVCPVTALGIWAQGPEECVCFLRTGEGRGGGLWPREAVVTAATDLICLSEAPCPPWHGPELW